MVVVAVVVAVMVVVMVVVRMTVTILLVMMQVLMLLRGTVQKCSESRKERLSNQRALKLRQNNLHPLALLAKLPYHVLLTHICYTLQRDAKVCWLKNKSEQICPLICAVG